MVDWITTKFTNHTEGLPMNTPSIRDAVPAAAVFSGAYAAVTRRAEQAGCGRQTLYRHARRVEQQLDPSRRQAETAELLAENRRLRDQLAASTRRSDRSVLCDSAKLREVATVGFAAGVSLRQIEDTLKALLPARPAPDHSTIGRRVADQAKKARAILGPLDAACATGVRTLALDEIFFGGGRLQWGSSRRA